MEEVSGLLPRSPILGWRRRRGWSPRPQAWRRQPRALGLRLRDNEDDDDEAGYRFEAHAFWPGEYVSISGQDRKLHTFRVVTVDPVVLSMALIKSFELQIKV